MLALDRWREEGGGHSFWDDGVWWYRWRRRWWQPRWWWCELVDDHSFWGGSVVISMTAVLVATTMVVMWTSRWSQWVGEETPAGDLGELAWILNQSPPSTKVKLYSQKKEWKAQLFGLWYVKSDGDKVLFCKIRWHVHIVFNLWIWLIGSKTATLGSEQL